MISVDLMSLWAFVCSVLLCFSVRNRTFLRVDGEFHLSRRIFLSLTELTDLTEPCCAQFWSHRTPSAFRIHRTLLPMKIPIRRQKQPTSTSHGYLGDYSPSLWGRGRGRGRYLYEPLCVLFICVFLWEIERTHSKRWDTCDSLGSFISHRAHRVHGAFWRTVSSPQKASGIQSSQSVTAKDGCKVLWNRLT